MGHLARIVLSQSRRDIIGNANVKMLFVKTFEDIDVFHIARLRPSGYDAAASATTWLAEPKQAKPAEAGGARRDRTADLVIANDALSQLSYGPKSPGGNLAAARDGKPPAIAAIYNPRQGQVKNGENAAFSSRWCRRPEVPAPPVASSIRDFRSVKRH